MLDSFQIFEMDNLFCFLETKSCYIALSGLNLKFSCLILQRTWIPGAYHPTLLKWQFFPQGGLLTLPTSYDCGYCSQRLRRQELGWCLVPIIINSSPGHHLLPLHNLPAPGQKTEDEGCLPEEGCAMHLCNHLATKAVPDDR